MTDKNHPLITIKKLQSDPEILLRNKPYCVLVATFADEPDKSSDITPPVVSVFGKKHRKAQTMTALQTAVLWEGS